MSAVSVTYFCYADECYPAVVRGIRSLMDLMNGKGWINLTGSAIPDMYNSIPVNISYGIGIGVALLFFAVYCLKVRPFKKGEE